MNPIRINNMLQAISKMVNTSENRIDAAMALANNLTKEVASILSSIASIRSEIKEIRKDIKDIKEESAKFKNKASRTASVDPLS